MKWSQSDLLEIHLEHPDDFLKVKETLTRIGVQVKDTQTLFQSCHILHKQSRYYIVHFKEMFLLDGKESTFTEEDASRRNTIAQLLSDWGLLTLSQPITSPMSTLKAIKIIPFKDKGNWSLCPKYEVGQYSNKLK